MRSRVCFPVMMLVLYCHMTAKEALAAEHYVLAGAQGGPGCGATWADACPELPQELARGDTYYVAAGTYPAYTFDDPPSGTSLIIVRKATSDDHGTDDGWTAQYGEGQAVFRADVNTPAWTFLAPYYLVDGQTGELDGIDSAFPGNDGTPHGFKLEVDLDHLQGEGGAVGCLNIQSYGGSEGHHITLEHIEMRHAGEDIHEPLCQRSVALYVQGEAGSELEEIAVRSCYLHDATGVLVHTGRLDHAFFEHCYFARRGHWQAGETHCHGEAFAVHPSSTDYTIAYSVFEDIEGSGVIVFGLTDGGVFNDIHIFGNVFFTRDPERYTVPEVIGCTNSPAFDGFYVYNNTIADYSSAGNYVFAVNLSDAQATGAEAVNNVFYDLGDLQQGFLFGNIAHDHNACMSHAGNCGNGFGENASMRDEPGGVMLTADPFFDGPQHDYHPTEAVGDGVVLSSRYNLDFDGLTRGVDGQWDCGAYEYPGEEVTCAEAGGVCCPSGQTCVNGTVHASSDCPSDCCVGGVCAEEPQQGGSDDKGCSCSSTEACEGIVFIMVIFGLFALAARRRKKRQASKKQAKG